MEAIRRDEPDSSATRRFPGPDSPAWVRRCAEAIRERQTLTPEAGDAYFEWCSGAEVSEPDGGIVAGEGEAPSAQPAPSGSCARCRGYGVLQRGDGSTVTCECQSARRVERLIADAGIPPLYRDARLTRFRADTPAAKAAYLRAKRFVAGEDYGVTGRGLLLVGPVGIGKTFLAVATLTEWMSETMQPGYYVEWGELLARLQSTFGRSADEAESSAEEILRVYREAPLLVLDEVGARRPSDWARDVLYGLVNTRYMYQRPTILTTNYPDTALRPGDETLEGRIGAPIRSRLYAMCATVPMDGPDARRVGVRA